MRMRYAELLADQDLTAGAGTEIVSIRGKDVISAIVVRFYGTALSTTISEHPASNITKLELVEDGRPIYSLTGQCAEAMDFYGFPSPRVNRIYYRNGQPWVTLAVIRFGRFIGDRELALDPKHLGNLQLKISFDENLANTSATANSCFVKAVLFAEDEPTPMGFLMTKEVKTYTPSANSWEYTELPTDFPLRTLAIQCRKTGTRFGSTVADLKLDEDNDKRIPFEDKASILAQVYASVWGWYQEHIVAYVGTSPTGVYITPGLDVAVGAGVMGALKSSEVELGVGCLMNVARETSAGYVQLNIGGWLPHHVLALPMGDRNTPEDWADLTNVDSLRLSLKGGASLGASDTFRIITEQLRKY